ncbi:MAG: helix-turn-helix domain-containing protein [Treponema sp.]|nr:helix-turn-helix domain-containing protein [Treponema sp.]
MDRHVDKSREVLELAQKMEASGFTEAEMAVVLGIDEGYLDTLKKAYREHGVEGLSHGNEGRKPGNTLDEEQRLRIIALRRKSGFSDMSIRHFRSELLLKEGIDISYTTLSNLLKSEELGPSARYAGAFARAEHPGDLAILFARPGDWLGNGGATVLHGLVDDATGRIVGLDLRKAECLAGYLSALRQMMKNFGCPALVATERAEILFGHKDVKGNPTEQTQLGRIVSWNMGCEVSGCGNLRNALRRVNRLLDSLLPFVSGRLRALDADGCGKANRYLELTAAAYNYDNAVASIWNNSVYVSAEDYDIDMVCAYRHRVVMEKDNVFFFGDLVFKTNSDAQPEGQEIEFVFGEPAIMKAHFDGRYEPVSCIGNRNHDSIIRDGKALEILLHDYCLTDPGTGEK